MEIKLPSTFWGAESLLRVLECADLTRSLLAHMMPLGKLEKVAPVDGQIRKRHPLRDTQIDSQKGNLVSAPIFLLS